ncbi:MAG: hypothetical protein PHF86_15170 [Candidatus Nanoarchaeia archaeon]|nr:hypothetical protein [Candidatus Nanoarchaeia archaeon]
MKSIEKELYVVEIYKSNEKIFRGKPFAESKVTEYIKEIDDLFKDLKNNIVSHISWRNENDELVFIPNTVLSQSHFVISNVNAL